MANIYSMSDTWNDAGTTFTGIGLNVTDTASASGSLLMDLQVGGTSIFKVGKGLTSPAVSIGAVALRDEGSGQFSVNRLFYFNSVSLGLNNRALAFGAAFGTYDTYLHRDAANTLALRNSTNAQTFNLYNTYTDASNYERGFMKWNANVLEIGTEAAGTGGARDVLVRRGGVKALEIQSGYFGFYNSSGTRTVLLNTSVGQFTNLTSGRYGFGTADTVDAHIYRPAAAVIGIGGAANAGGSAEFKEIASAPAAATDAVRIYAEDDGAGKTRLMALFPTGAAQQIAIEP